MSYQFEEYKKVRNKDSNIMWWRVSNTVHPSLLKLELELEDLKFLSREY
jgi:hypothetical protein